MPEHLVSVPHGATIAAALADIPSSVKAVLRGGFAELANLPQEKVELLAANAQQFLSVPRPRLTKEIAAQLEIDEGNAESIIIAAGLIISLMSVGPSRVDELLDAAIESAVLDSRSRSAIGTFAAKLAEQTPQLKAIHQRLEVSNETLASFRSLSTSVDLRLAFDGDSIAVAVPVAVAALFTDAAHEVLWFQMTKEQVAELHKQLEQLHKRLVEAERLAKPLIEKLRD